MLVVRRLGRLPYGEEVHAGHEDVEEAVEADETTVMEPDMSPTANLATARAREVQTAKAEAFCFTSIWNPSPFH